MPQKWQPDLVPGELIEFTTGAIATDRPPHEGLLLLKLLRYGAVQCGLTDLRWQRFAQAMQILLKLKHPVLDRRIFLKRDRHLRPSFIGDRPDLFHITKTRGRLLHLPRHLLLHHLRSAERRVGTG